MSERQDGQDKADDLDMSRVARMVGVLGNNLLNQGQEPVSTAMIVAAATPEIARKVLNNNDR